MYANYTTSSITHMQKYGTTNIKQSKRTKTPTYCLARKQKNIRVYWVKQLLHIHVRTFQNLLNNSMLIQSTQKLQALYTFILSLVSRSFVCGWRKKEPGTHCLCMLGFPRISGNLETFVHKITKTPLGMPTFSAWKIPATDNALCRSSQRRDKGIQLFTCRNCSPVPPF